MTPRSSDRPSGEDRPRVRTRTPRPDELTQEVFEFISAIDDYKRRNMRAFLQDAEVLEILMRLGYHRDGQCSVTDKALEDFAAVRERYRVEEGRLFPTWSEVFSLLADLGYERA